MTATSSESHTSALPDQTRKLPSSTSQAGRIVFIRFSCRLHHRKPIGSSVVSPIKIGAGEDQGSGRALRHWSELRSPKLFVRIPNRDREQGETQSLKATMPSSLQRQKEP